MTTLAKSDGQLDLCFEIREKVLWNNLEPDLGLLEPKDNFDDDLRQRMVTPACDAGTNLPLPAFF